MKKQIKTAAAIALALSAVTPVAAFAAETASVAPGLYTADSFTPLADFNKKTVKDKVKALVNPSAVLVLTNNGKTVKADLILSASNEELAAATYATAEAYATENNVEFTENGVKAPTDATELKVESVSAINATKLEIKFDREVDSKTATNPNNYYFGITAAAVNNSIGELNSSLINNATTGQFTITLGADKKTVTIETKDKTYSIWNDKNNTSATELVIGAAPAAAIVKDKTAYIQVRNVKDATGKLQSTVQQSFLASDKVAPAIAEAKEITSGQTTAATVTFSEPIHLDTNVKLYLNSRILTATTDYTLSADGKTLTLVDGANYEVGTHKLEIVGAEDLAGNRPVGDVLTTNIVVKDATPTDNVVPEVTSVKQISEGQFTVSFNTAVQEANIVVKNLVGATDSTGLNITGTPAPTSITDKDGNLLKDRASLVSTHTTIPATTTYVRVNAAGNPVKADGTEITAPGTATDYVGGTPVAFAYTVNFATNTTSDANYYQKVYNTSTEITRTVEVKNIKSAAGVVGTKNYSQSHKFELDHKAPTVTGDVVVENTAAAPTIEVKFLDNPFNGAVVAGSPTEDIVVKQFINGETKTVTIPASYLGSGGVTFNTATKTFAIDFAALRTQASGASNTSLVSAIDAFRIAAGNTGAGELKAGDYSITLPASLVTENTSSPTQFTTPARPYAGETKTFKVTGSGTGASVPQTGNKLVTYNSTLKALEVYFVGEDIDATTATKASNYTLAGKVLDEDTRIEFESLDNVFELDASGAPTATSVGKGGVARIYLKENTIVRNGSYSLKVENVATKADGAKMIVSNLVVSNLIDNTKPVLESAVATGNGQITLTFSESIISTEGTKDYAALLATPAAGATAATGSAENFTVLLNGAETQVTQVALDPAASPKDNVLVIHTATNFNATATTVEVKVVENPAGQVVITDKGGNKLTTGTVIRVR